MFAVVFSGELEEGRQLSSVKLAVSQLFKVDAHKIEHLFSGQWVVIKRGLEQPTAEKYRLALQGVGAICRVIDEDQIADLNRLAPRSRLPTATPEPTPTTEGPRTVAHSVAHSVVKELRDGSGELAFVTVDREWVKLDESPPALAPNIVLDGYELAAVGEELAPHVATTALEVDLHGITLAEPGAVIMPESVTEPLDIDVTHIHISRPE